MLRDFRSSTSPLTPSLGSTKQIGFFPNCTQAFSPGVRQRPSAASRQHYDDQVRSLSQLDSVWRQPIKNIGGTNRGSHWSPVKERREMFYKRERRCPSHCPYMLKPP